MATAQRVHEFDIPTRNGKDSERIRPHDSLHGWRRWIAIVKQPTTLPRGMLLLSHGALIATVIAGAIAFGRASNRTEAALARSEQVPALSANFNTLTLKLDEISQKQDKAAEQIGKRLDAQQTQINSLAALSTQVAAIQGQMGSVWALAQSDSNKISRLEGMIIAMQSQKKDDK